MNSTTVKHVTIWVLTICCLLVAWRFFVQNMNTSHDKAISLSQALSDAEASKVSTVTVTGAEVNGEYKGSKETFTTTIPANYPDFYKDLRDHAHSNTRHGVQPPCCF